MIERHCNRKTQTCFGAKTKTYFSAQNQSVCDASNENGFAAKLESSSDAGLDILVDSDIKTCFDTETETGYTAKICTFSDSAIEKKNYYSIDNLPGTIMNKNKDLRDIEAMHDESVLKLEANALFNFDTLVFGSFCQSSTRFSFTS